MLKPHITEKLLPHQPAVVERLLQDLHTHGAALDASDTGVGKTYHALAVAATLDVPTVAVVPKIAITSWQRAAAHLGADLDVVGWEMLRTGNTPFGKWGGERKQVFQCSSCLESMVEPLVESECRNNPDGHDWQSRQRTPNKGFIWEKQIKFIIFDEIHRANGIKTQNAQMVVAAKAQGRKVLGLSATPATTPLHFWALGFLLGFHELDGDRGFYRWSRGLGCRRHPKFKGWHWMVGEEKQQIVMRGLNSLIFPERGVRVRTSDIPNFPTRRIQASLLDLGSGPELERLYDEMKVAMEALRQRRDSDEHADHPLVKLVRLRQEVELLKVPLAESLAQDYIAQRKSVAIFVNFVETMHALRERLSCDCFVDGTQDQPEKRQAHIDRFQNGQSRLILVNNQAGGVACSLHDIHGVYPCVGLVFPSQSATVMRQVFGRLHRQGGKSEAYYRVLFAANTREEQIHRKLSGKLNNLDALIDSDLLPNNLCLTSE